MSNLNINKTAPIFCTLPTKNYCLVSAAAEGKSKLTSFDHALLKSGIANVNLIKISSILPPNSQTHQQSPEFPAGALVPIAYAEKISSKPGELISSAVSIGLPTDQRKNGVIMEKALRQSYARTVHYRDCIKRHNATEVPVEEE